MNKSVFKKFVLGVCIVLACWLLINYQTTQMAVLFSTLGFETGSLPSGVTIDATSGNIVEVVASNPHMGTYSLHCRNTVAGSSAIRFAFSESDSVYVKADVMRLSGGENNENFRFINIIDSTDAWYVHTSVALKCYGASGWFVNWITYYSDTGKRETTETAVSFGDGNYHSVQVGAVRAVIGGFYLYYDDVLIGERLGIDTTDMTPANYLIIGNSYGSANAEIWVDDIYVDSAFIGVAATPMSAPTPSPSPAPTPTPSLAPSETPAPTPTPSLAPGETPAPTPTLEPIKLPDLGLSTEALCIVGIACGATVVAVFYLRRKK